uniref:Transposase n=1 Tax=blood disease bacterium R229 TaxID=741978 RepID=G2ZTX4_9RALS|nr:transposase [blood disease bacterium R229]
MKTSKFTEAQIAFALKQAELGTKVEEVCRKLGISEATFYNWKKKYGGVGPSELRRMRQLEEENAKLKRLVADLSLDKAMEPVRIFVGEAVKKTLPACLCESFTKQDSELVHGRLPVEGSPDGLGQHIAQRQPEQLDGGLVIGEVTARLDDLA